MKNLLIALLAALLCGAVLPAFAAAPHRVALYKSVVMPLAQPAGRVSVGNPGVADILLLNPSELYVVGKALGSTNVTVWSREQRVFQTFDVEVTHDVDTLKQKLHELFPNEPIKVFSAQEQLVLSGQVTSAARMDAIRTLAAGFLPDCIRAESDAADTRSRAADPSCKKGSVVNLMQVGGANQVMLKVTVAEMNRSVVKRLDSNLNIMRFGNRMTGGAVQGGATFPDAEVITALPDGSGTFTGSVPVLGGALSPPVNPIGPYADLFSPSMPTIDSSGLFMSYLTGNLFVEAVIDISKRNGLAKVLSEPTLTTMTGQEAHFLSGGEFPVPVPQSGTNNTTIEFKEFGVGVRFLPVVLDSGRINLSLKIDVSELSNDNRVVLTSSNTTSAFSIPSLSKRSATSTVELADGQTIGIAGLINDNLREFVDKLPGLGDLPLIGPLFRSQEFVSGQTELVIFVTPHLARPIAPDRIKLPTDGFVPPGDWEFYLLGQLESSSRPSRRSAGAPASAPPPARFGHDTLRGKP